MSSCLEPTCSLPPSLFGIFSSCTLQCSVANGERKCCFGKRYDTQASVSASSIKSLTHANNSNWAADKVFHLTSTHDENLHNPTRCEKAPRVPPGLCPRYQDLGATGTTQAQTWHRQSKSGGLGASSRVNTSSATNPWKPS